MHRVQQNEGEAITRMTPGQAAYEAWAKTLSATAMGNAEMMASVARYLDQLAPPWKTLIPDTQQVWEAIAQAAINQHIDNRDAMEQAYEPPTY